MHRAQSVNGRRIIGVSPWARRMQAEIERAAPSNSTVLITGPTGTGKELIARAIHACSPRAGGPFVAVDCGAIADGLFVSQLFGHRKGAFTGADQESLGCFRAAEGGTIFLDEVGELGLDLQVKLLRVLQERTVVPVGGHQEHPVDVRVVAATNRDLRQAVAAGQFRQDLYYRLHVVSLATLPLRDRSEDIGPLASYLLEQFALCDCLPVRRLTREAVKRLQTYNWPGNVRQLENLLERAVLFSQDDPLGEDVILEMLSDQPESEPDERDTRAETAAGPPTLPSVPRHEEPWPTLAELEREYIRRVLERTHYNQSAAARLLGVERHLLRRKMDKYGIAFAKDADRGEAR